ncbi:tyramine receptor 1 [Calliphora vicina]|uniref:tyramine receptor 1 n=1 Tax=Calliphora vicina TaxID=7373 RepID=UPI00325B634A
MDEADVYYTQLNKEYNYNKLYEIHEINSLRNCDTNINAESSSCHSKESNKIGNRYQHTRSSSNSSSCSTKGCLKCGQCHYNKHFNRLQKNPYMYSYVAHAITAAASTAAVAAAETATSTHERLKFVYDNSHASSLAAYDENIFNNTFILATSSSSSAASSSSSAASYTSSSSTSATSAFAISYGNLNDSTSAGSSSASASSSASSSPASSSAAAGSTPSSPLIEVGVNVSLTSSDDWSHFYDLVLSWQGICLIAVFCAFIVITIIGNTLVILAVITTRRLKTVTNCFVMSLAVADLLVGIFVMPPAVAVHLIGSWQLGWVLCDIWISLDVLLCTASILSLCAISVDRYLAVTQPLTYSRKRRSKRLALIMILIVWVLALAITCPPILGWYEPGRRDLNECRYNQNEGYVIFSAMGSFFIPMAVMIYVYARISCVIANRHDNMTDISVHNKKFKRYTAADIDNELDPDLSEFDLSSGQKKQQAARTLSNQTLAKDLQEIMASDNEIANTTQCHTLLVLQQQAANSPTDKNGCYEMKRPASLKRTPTASSVITTMTSTTSTGAATATATVAMGMENPWTFTPTTQHHQQQQHSHYQQHAHPNKHMRTHSMRHQHYLNTASPNINATTTTNTVATSPGNTLTPDSIVTGSGSSILRPHTPQLRSHHHQHTHHYTTKSLSNRISSLKKETKTTQTLSIVVGGFIACWLPFFINYLITPFLDEDQVSSTLAKVLTWLGWFNSAINPFIYAFYSVDFRAAFWRLTCKRFFSASNKPQFPTNTMSIRR